VNIFDLAFELIRIYPEISFMKFVYRLLWLQGRTRWLLIFHSEQDVNTRGQDQAIQIFKYQVNLAQSSHSFLGYFLLLIQNVVQVSSYRS